MKIKHLFASLLAAAGFAAGNASAQAAAPIEVNFGHTTADHVTLYVAQDLGLFEKVGIKPKFFTFASGAPLLAGLKSESLDVALALSLAVVVAAELVGAQSGLGFMISDAAMLFRIPVVFIGIALIGAIGLAMNLTLNWLEARIVHWKGR